jgi:hypothetical protein
LSLNDFCRPSIWIADMVRFLSVFRRASSTPSTTAGWFGLVRC